MHLFGRKVDIFAIIFKSRNVDFPCKRECDLILWLIIHYEKNLSVDDQRGEKINFTKSSHSFTKCKNSFVKDKLMN